MNMKWFTQILLLTFITNISWAGEEDMLKLVQTESDLQSKLESLRNTRNVEELKKRNQLFKEALKNAVQYEGAFDYAFDSLKTISKITSPDQQFRIFNWNIEFPDYSQHYECLVLYKKNDRKTILFELKDASATLPYHYDGPCKEEEWFGALYYDIAATQKGSRSYYTLIGYDGNTSRSNIKILESMYFVGNSVRFGYPIFDTEDGVKKRVFLEYAENAVVSVKYNPQKQQIVYDHLRPESPNLEGFYEYYVPDMSYDAFKKQPNGQWSYHADITPMNSQSKMDDYWKNPTDENTPVDNGKHVAVPVDKDNANKRKESKTNKTKKRKARFKSLKNPKTYHNSKKSKIYH